MKRKIRLGLYDPLAPDAPPRLIGRRYRNTARNRRIILATLAKYRLLAEHDSTMTLCLGAFRVARKGVRYE